MDVNNKIIRLCVEGSKAEFMKNTDKAIRCYQQAWDEHQNNYEGCIAAHYLARFKDAPDDIFYWNKKALDLANLSDNDDVKEFFPSLYVNMGKSYELLGDKKNAVKYYEKAEKFGIKHSNSNKKKISNLGI